MECKLKDHYKEITRYVIQSRVDYNWKEIRAGDERVLCRTVEYAKECIAKLKETYPDVRFRIKKVYVGDETFAGIHTDTQQ